VPASAQAAAAVSADTTATSSFQVVRSAARGPSPGRALAIGFGATVAPALLAVALDPPKSHSAFAWEAALALGAAVGVIAGPAVGLRSGGRGDLARRGLITRGIGGLAAGAGVGAAVASFDSGMNAGAATILVLLGALGGLITTVSWIHDLAITPSAVASGRPPRASGRPPRAEPEMQPNIILELRMRF
jgi:hypothetical protein